MLQFHLSLPSPPQPRMDPRLLLSVRRRSSHLARSLARMPFLGERLDLGSVPTRMTGRVVLPTICAAVKRRKESPLDNVIQRDKKLKLVLKIRRILVSQPDRMMSLRELGKYRKYLGLTRKRRFIALLKRFPAVFEIIEEGVYSLKFRLTPEAEQIYFEELRIRNEADDDHITKLRKLLMMSLEKRILISKIAHLKADLGLPLEFKDTVCQRYPQYFKLVRTNLGAALELTHWDPKLAVSVAEVNEEENRRRELEERNLIIDRPLKFKRVQLPKGLNLSKREMWKINRFRDMPYISPYSDFSELKSGSLEKEKHACGVVHEILSLTNEKRTLVDHLTHFREEFRFSQQLRGMLIRHPDMFYVSLKGDRDSVFLREAYRDSQLVEKNRLLILKEKMRALVAVPRFGRRRIREAGEGEADGKQSEEALDDDEEDEMSDDNYDDVDDKDDYWSDEEDEVPPNFDDDDEEGFDSVSPRETYRNRPLVERDRMLALKEKTRAVVEVPRFGRRHTGEGVEGKTDGKRLEKAPKNDDEGQWYGNDAKEDETIDGNFDDGDDDWSDEDSEVPPDFDDDDDDEGLDSNRRRPFQRVNFQGKDRIPVSHRGRPRFNATDRNHMPALHDRRSNANPEDNNQDPVLPSGRPRERW